MTTQHLPVFTIEKSYRFDSGHTLTQHDGKCKSPHGHTYTLHVQMLADKCHRTLTCLE